MFDILQVSPTRPPSIGPPAKLSPPTRTQQLRDAAIQAFMQQSCPNDVPSVHDDTPQSRQIRHVAMQSRKGKGTAADDAADVQSDESADRSVHDYQGNLPRMAGLARWVEAEEMDSGISQHKTQAQHKVARTQHGQAKAQHGQAIAQRSTQLPDFGMPERSGAAEQDTQPQNLSEVNMSFEAGDTKQSQVIDQTSTAEHLYKDMLSDRLSHASVKRGAQDRPESSTSGTTLNRNQTVMLLHEGSHVDHHSMQSGEPTVGAQDVSQEMSAGDVDPEVAQLATDFSNSQLAEFQQSFASERLVAIHVRSEQSLTHM